MKDRRPVNLDLRTIRQPLAAIASITHRVSGVIVFFGIAGLLYLFDISLTSEADFTSLRDGLGPVSLFLLWGVLSALAYHLVAGAKHLLLDIGLGESKEGGPRGAQITFVVSIVLAVLVGLWLW